MSGQDSQTGVFTAGRGLNQYHLLEGNLATATKITNGHSFWPNHYPSRYFICSEKGTKTIHYNITSKSKPLEMTWTPGLGYSKCSAINWLNKHSTSLWPYGRLESQWKFAVWRRELTFGAEQQPKGGGVWWGGGDSRGGDTQITYGWLMPIYGRNQHDTVKQLSSDQK